MAETFATPDVRQLRDEELDRAQFPAQPNKDFRVYFDANVHEKILQHASEDVSVEICGVLVGKWEQDDDGPFVGVSEFIRCDAADSKVAEVTFTHEAWAKINEQMDTRFSDLKIVGWYHSHPDFGIFLSDRDAFIQEHFFSSPGQVAFVVDPVRKTEGIFLWQQGKSTAAPHYWIGDKIYVPESRAEQPAASPVSPASGPESGPQQAMPVEMSMMSVVVRTLAYVAIFLVGYMLSGMRSSWEQRMLVEGTVAHFGIWKGLRPGLKEALNSVDSNLQAVSASIDTLSTGQGKRDGDKTEPKQEDWKKARNHVSRTRDLVRMIEAAYCLSPEEEAAVRKVVASRLAEIGGGRRAKSDEKQKDESDQTKAKAKSPRSKSEARNPKSKTKSTR